MNALYMNKLWFYRNLSFRRNIFSQDKFLLAFHKQLVFHSISPKGSILWISRFEPWACMACNKLNIDGCCVLNIYLQFPEYLYHTNKCLVDMFVFSLKRLHFQPNGNRRRMIRSPRLHEQYRIEHFGTKSTRSNRASTWLKHGAQPELGYTLKLARAMSWVLIAKTGVTGRFGMFLPWLQHNFIKCRG